MSDGGDDPDAAADEVAGDCAGQDQHARGKDERDHTCRVHLERDMGGAATEDAVTADLLGHLDGNAALGFIHVDDGYDGDQAQGAEHQHRTDVRTGGEALQNLVGQAGNDAAKNDDRHALPDSVLRDQFTHPHQQHRASRHRDDDGQRAEWILVEAEILDDGRTATGAEVDQIGRAEGLRHS